MKATKQEFLTAFKNELGDNFEYSKESLDNGYYELIEIAIRGGNKISKAVYESLSNGQQYHFNRSYNYRGDKVEN